MGSGSRHLCCRMLEPPVQIKDRGGLGWARSRVCVRVGEARVFVLEGHVVVLEESVLFEEQGVPRLHRHKRLFQVRLPHKEVPGW